MLQSAFTVQLIILLSQLMMTITHALNATTAVAVTKREPIEVKIGVLLPYSSKGADPKYSLQKVLPAIEIAISKAKKDEVLSDSLYNITLM